MKIAVAKEIDPSEPRVAASPDTVKKYKAIGLDVAVEPGAGLKSGLPDTEFTAVGATGETSGQENRHQGEDDGDGGGAVFHQLDEALIGLLMRLIIIAVSGRVRHFVMLCHRSPQSMFASRVELPQS